MQTVTVGVVGVGALGRIHAKLYRGLPDVQLAGVYDANPDTAQAVAAEFGVPCYRTVEELAAVVDGVSVAVPTDKHYEAVLPLLRLGRHVLVEKPIARTIAEAQELVHEARVRNLILMVGHVERYNPVVACLDKTPGEARFIEAHRLAPYPPLRPGLRPRGTEVSVVLDLMIHDLDIIQYLVRSPVKQVDAVGVALLSPTEDIANARIQFENGCVANVTASRVSQERMRKIRVFKPHAYLSLDYQTQTGETVYLAKTGLVREPVPIVDANALQLELTEFCACIQTGKTTGRLQAPKVSGEDGMKALVLAERILEAIRIASLVGAPTSLPA